MRVARLLEKLEINPETVLVIRDDTLVTQTRAWRIRTPSRSAR